MLCPSPAVRPDTLKLRSQHWRSYDEMRLKIGFVMDDVQPVREMQNYFPSLPNEIIYVPDPKFYVLSSDGGVKLYKGESLVIEVSLVSNSIYLPSSIYNNKYRCFCKLFSE